MDVQCATQVQSAVPDVQTNTVMQEQAQYAAFRQICMSLRDQALGYQSGAETAMNDVDAACESANSLLALFRAQAVASNPSYQSSSAIELANNPDLGNLWLDFADDYTNLQKKISDSYAIIDGASKMIDQINQQYQAAYAQYEQFYQTSVSNIPTPDQLAQSVQSMNTVPGATPPNMTVATASAQNDLSNSANAIITNAIAASGVGPSTVVPSTIPTSIPALPSAPGVTAPSDVSQSTPAAAAPSSISAIIPTAQDVSDALNQTAAQTANASAIQTPSGATDLNSVLATPITIPVVATAQTNLLLWAAGIAAVLWVLS